MISWGEKDSTMTQQGTLHVLDVIWSLLIKFVNRLHGPEAKIIGYESIITGLFLADDLDWPFADMGMGFGIQ